MANVDRYLYGPQCLINVPVATGTVIEKGDFVLLVNNYAIQPDDQADAGDAAANREEIETYFIGIAQTASAVGETEPVVVDISTLSVYELEQKAAAAIHVGDQLECYASADHCENQTVVEGSTSPIAICVEEKGASGTAVKACLVGSKIFHIVGA